MPTWEPDAYLAPPISWFSDTTETGQVTLYSSRRARHQGSEDSTVSALETRYPGQSFTAHVFDTRSGCSYTMNPGERLRTASVFKVMVMAGTLLEAREEGRPITAWELSQLKPMITESANSPVRALWSHFGGSPWFTRQAEIFGLDETRAVGDAGGVWGTTTTSAKDQVDLLRQVLIGEWGPLHEEYRAEAWDLMTSVVPSQTWGITAGVPDGWTVAQKNGFAVWERGVPAVETIAGWVSASLAH